MLDVAEPEEALFMSPAERTTRSSVLLVRLLPWEEISCVAIVLLEVLHGSRPWHTAVLGVILAGYLMAVHVAESGVTASTLLRRHARVLVTGVCVLALSTGAALLPASPGTGSAILHVLAAAAVIAAAILILPG
jgi:hypothetical protein